MGGLGSDEDERWQEASLLLPLSLPEAIRLAARFGQNALCWVREGELWLVPVLLEGTPCHLGRLRPAGGSGLQADMAPRHPDRAPGRWIVSAPT